MVLVLEILVVCGLVMGCESATPQREPVIPSWALQPQRRELGEKIVYTESEDYPTAELSRQNALASVYADIANECSFVPNVLLPPRVFVHKVASVYETYVSVEITRADCRFARDAMTKLAITSRIDLHSTEMVQEQRRAIGETVALLDEAAGSDARTTESEYFALREKLAIAKESAIVNESATVAGEALKSDAQVSVLARIQAYESKRNVTAVRSDEAKVWTSFRHALLAPKQKTSNSPLNVITPPPKPKTEKPVVRAGGHSGSGHHFRSGLPPGPRATPPVTATPASAGDAASDPSPALAPSASP